MASVDKDKDKDKDKGEGEGEGEERSTEEEERLKALAADKFKEKKFVDALQSGLRSYRIDSSA